RLQQQQTQPGARAPAAGRTRPDPRRATRQIHRRSGRQAAGQVRSGEQASRSHHRALPQSLSPPIPLPPPTSLPLPPRRAVPDPYRGPAPPRHWHSAPRSVRPAQPRARCRRAPPCYCCCCCCRRRRRGSLSLCSWLRRRGRRRHAGGGHAGRGDRGGGGVPAIRLLPAAEHKRPGSGPQGVRRREPAGSLRGRRRSRGRRPGAPAQRVRRQAGVAGAGGARRPGARGRAQDGVLHPRLVHLQHLPHPAALSKIILLFQAKGIDSAVEMSWKDYFMRVVPTALGTALDINLSNASLVFITVTFATMCKSASPIFLLLFAFAFRLESPSIKLLGIIVVISIGVLLTVARETAFDFWGFIFVTLAAVMSGFRWSMTQILLQVRVMANVIQMP
uniref:Sugar phosphate transporter domain-containing protein n=1 Tax=Triticum urartu TaxID=4572 RepID=A0A8R7QWI2_TRIUA